jgi:polysaccharide export outer membrane protein
MKYKFPFRPWSFLYLVLIAAMLALPLALHGQSAQPAQSPNPPASSESDVLKVNDLVRLTVYKEDDMLTETRVSKSGNITLPLLGSVHVEGKTVAEAAADIRAALDKDYIINPQVTLTILEYAPQWVTVLGEVQRPSQVQIPPDGGLDLMGAIALAGGYTRVADPSRIIVRRVVNGSDVVLKVDATKLARDTKAPVFLVQPGDTISVAESAW